MMRKVKGDGKVFYSDNNSIVELERNENNISFEHKIDNKTINRFVIDKEILKALVEEAVILINDGVDVKCPKKK